jgi:cell wall-associated NlpC family hydrolase
MNLWLVKSLVEPVRREPSHSSEMVDQVLGGMILSEATPTPPGSAKPEWIHALIPNGYPGYVRSWMCEPVLPSNPWCVKPGVMVGDRWLSSIPEGEGDPPIDLGMGTRCLGTVGRKNSSTASASQSASMSASLSASVETPWGCRLELPSSGLLSATKPFAIGFFGGSKKREGEEAHSIEDLSAVLKEALKRSRSLLKVPYLWGGLSPGGLDCSGLVHLCMGMEGWLLPRDAGDQYYWFTQRGFGQVPDAPAISNAASRPGLAFFGESIEKIDHVGFLDGNGGMIHSSGNVHKTPLSPEPDEEGQRLLAKCRWIVLG